MARARAAGAAKTKGMHSKGDKKTKGRTSISGSSDLPMTSKPNTGRSLKTEANRPVEAGGTKHRGDRRDMSKTYTNNRKHSSRGDNPRADTSTRKR